ncbi:MAG: oxidoreductase, partial [Acidobacteriota bacterium]
PPDVPLFASAAHPQITGILERIRSWLSPRVQSGQRTYIEYINEISQRMSRHGAQIRNSEEIHFAIEQAYRCLREIKRDAPVRHRTDLPGAFRALELAVTHALYLDAIGEYVDRGGRSRGSYLILDRDGDHSCGKIGDNWRFSLTEEEAFVNRNILELAIDSEDRVHKHWVPVRPIPAVDEWFENVWKRYLDGQFYDDTEH